MHPLSHLERGAPCTPVANRGLEFQSPASSSRKRFSLSAWTSPLKSLRSRRKSSTSGNQNPTTWKRNQPLFNLFHTSQSRAHDSTDAFKDGIGPQRPKTKSSSKEYAGDSKSRYTANLVIHSTDILVEYFPIQPKRSKSFGDLLGSISNRVSSKYNTVSGRNQRRGGIDHHFDYEGDIGYPNNENLNLASASGSITRLTARILEKERIRKIESEMDAFWQLEEEIDSKLTTSNIITILTVGRFQE